MTVQEWLGKDNKLGIDIWKQKYCYNEESFDEWLDRISGEDQAIKQMIIEKKFLFGGRILSNRGLHNKGMKVTYSNCYVVTPPEDNIESIFDCAKSLARTFSYGGGVGIDISKLSPRGAKVNNTAKETSGAVSFMDLYSLVTGLIGQNGRRGALMISLDCSHPDIEEFIGIKSDLDKVTKANISVKMTDEFMDAVINDLNYTMTFTRTETGENITKEVRAKELFQKIAEMNWDYAEPGCLFWDRIKQWNLLSNTEEFEFAGTNPCVSGDTLTLTDNGFKRIDSLVGIKANIWNGYRFSEVTTNITGYNQAMKRITFSDGSELKCTNYHKFILKDSNRVEARQLKIGDKLIKCFYPIIHKGSDIDDSIAYTQGFFTGDGSEETNRNRLTIKLYGEKRKLTNRLVFNKQYYCPSFDGNLLILKYDTKIYNKEFVPELEYNIKSRLSWLAGYIDSDGTIQANDGSISISSINKEVLLKVKYMLNTLGCTGTISVMYPEDNKAMPSNDGSNTLSIYHCQKSFRLLISAYNVRELINLGLILSRVDMKSIPNRNASRFISVDKIEDIENADKVYCFNEPLNHSGIFNGVITGQCAEEPLPAGGSCLLGSINLSEFVVNPFHSQSFFDYETFRETVKVATKALNDVLEEGLPLHPLQEQKDSVKDWRQIGLGIFGLADMLIKMGIEYGSDESITFCDKIAFTMMDTAIRTSARLAKVDGCYPKCCKSEVLTTPFLLNNTTNKTKELVKLYGLRNSQLLTIAPTGTLSTMLGISGGIEPIFANYYERKTESLYGKDVYYKVYTPIVGEYRMQHNISDDEDLPNFFVTAQTLDYKKRVDMQSVWQDHIDASISSTVNVPYEFTKEETENLYQYAWEKGLKGITIFRDGCKRIGILTTENGDKNNNSQELKRGFVIQVNDDVIGKKRKLMTGCGSLHCTAFFDPKTGDLLETYLSKGSTGGCNNFMIGLSRMISLSARSGCDITTIIDQLNSCGTCPSYTVRTATKGDTSKGSCCPIAVGNALLDMYYELRNDLGFPIDEMATEDKPARKKNRSHSHCPQCGEEIIYEGGCNTCRACGWSKCS